MSSFRFFCLTCTPKRKGKYMKRIHWAFVWMTALLITGTAVAQTSGDRKAERKAYVGRRIADKHFKIEVSMAYPMRGRSIPLTTLYSLELKRDSADVYLPYFGRAYSIPYGGGKGLRFCSSVTDWKVEKKKRGYAVSFSSKTEEDTYDFFIDIGDEGAASISVTMRNRQSIRYSGEMEVDEAEDGKPEM